MTSEHTSESFPQRLQRLLDASGLTQEELASRLIIDRSYFNRLLKGKKTPSPRLVQQVTLLEKVGVTKEHTSALPHVTEEQAAYGAPEMLRKEIRSIVNDTITQAGDDVSRLGWALEQARTHMVAPARWSTASSKFVRIRPKTETGQSQPSVSPPARTA